MPSFLTRVCADLSLLPCEWTNPPPTYSLLCYRLKWKFSTARLILNRWWLDDGFPPEVIVHVHIFIFIWQQQTIFHSHSQFLWSIFLFLLLCVRVTLFHNKLIIAQMQSICDLVCCDWLLALEWWKKEILCDTLPSQKDERVSCNFVQGCRWKCSL